MFYPSLQLRQWTTPCTPKGPSFRQAKKHQVVIGGNAVEFKLPASNPRSCDQRIKPKRHYDLNHLQSVRYSSDKEGWLYSPIAKQIWNFYGPWFLGWMASANCNMGVIEKNEPSNTSFFHPRTFENAIFELMAFQYDERISDNYEDQLYFAPHQWRALEHYPVPAAHFLALNNHDKQPVFHNRHHLIFPISDNHLVGFMFSLHRRWKWVDNKAVENNDEWLPLEPMETLIKHIIDSVSVELSPQAEAQKQAAQAGLTDTSLVKVFPPVNLVECEKRR